MMSVSGDDAKGAAVMTDKEMIATYLTAQNSTSPKKVDTIRHMLPESFRHLADVYVENFMHAWNNEELCAEAHEYASGWVWHTYREATTQKVRKGNCPRCGGTGYIEAYRHLHNGVCLRCEGTGNIK